MFPTPRLATAVAAAPAVAAVAAQLSSEHLQLLVSCRCERTLAAYEEDEQQLIEAALSLSVEEFSQVVRAWLALADPDGSETARRRDEQAARVHLSRTLDGWWVLSGLLAPEDGEVLHAALEAGVDRRLRAAHDGDPSLAGRPVASWRAQALVDLASNDMRREPSEHSAPDRYRIALLLRPSELGSAPAGALCDSDVYRLVMEAGSEVLDVGRSSPVWPPGMRRGITARDRGCVFPGCDRPPSWCDIHHCKPWSRGETPPSTTGRCSVGCITPSSTATAGKSSSPPGAHPRSTGPTAPCSPSVANHHFTDYRGPTRPRLPSGRFVPRRLVGIGTPADWLRSTTMPP